MNIGSDLSFFSLIFGASLPVQLVMLILIAASVISWKFIYLKVKFLKESEENAQEFEKFFWSGGDLAKLYESVSNNSRAINGLAEIFRSGYKEYMGQKEHQAFDKKSIESVRRAMRASYNREIDTLDQHLPFLASVGSVSPYIGLFGTVWGIMNAFIGLSNVAQATLSQVAPGIAEALIATAIGLFAAIPAVIAYNRFATKVDRLSLRFESFIEEFINIVDRKG
ncbi:protein TolQ [Methylophilaceae bacterium]|jgi:biopolymer transport protein TolQ|nr:protein TolQ [Nitrosomonadales bacterium]MCH9842232.1 protein TolQ [Betaproteobacteria bacterium]MDA7751531.1 protein TolQ [Methylophilaceae bacterium]MDA9085921.1 protein TolQ [Methylophilaceae bacterium]MDA9087851.1 protein TolQ [Methylophilaceae bacterium]|tara:strand:- start:166 stop:837 length:672 start_codon:yes stop_codon:yes gene_type:complete